MAENDDLSVVSGAEPKPKPECELSPVWLDLLCDSRVMFDHARKTGVKLPPNVADKLGTAIANAAAKKPVDTKELQGVYNALLDRLAPATPQSIRDSDPAVSPRERFKRRRTVYVMLAVSAVCLVGFVWTLIALQQSAATQSNYVLPLHLAFAAGLGAAFNALFTVYGYLVRRTYDPKYNMTYWIRFALGVVGGVILAQFIEPKAAFEQGQAGVLKQLTPGLVALLGGYAAEAVQLVLKRIVEMLVALVQGGAQARVETATAQLKAQQERDRVRQRLGIIQQIAKRAKELGTETDPAKVKEKLEELQLSLLEEEHPD